MENFPWSLAKASKVSVPLPPSHETGPWGGLALPVLNVVSLPCGLIYLPVNLEGQED